MTTDNNTPVYNEKVTSLAIRADKRFSITNLTGIIMIIGFLVVIGLTISKSFSEQQINKKTILLRQGDLLNILKTSNNELETQQAVYEYDSLTRILDIIENK